MTEACLFPDPIIVPNTVHALKTACTDQTFVTRGPLESLSVTFTAHGKRQRLPLN